ncbi:PIN domain-containing protein [Paraburkholderia sacchari]|uniref:PIN domain-containing protein n=1 Tax=Paraburkholderia sacchari TaxID=159450 RepID=UPI001BCA90F4|nr:PIN domain-containing protein [Paraburkholderia sacchari]
MAINLTIAADVVDISVDQPTEKDTFLVDTNVWYWMTYTKASHVGAKKYQTIKYPQYTNDALNARARIYQSPMSLAELSHVIERSERDIYNKALANPALELGTKEFRHNCAPERHTVCSEIQAACIQVTALADPLTVTLDGDASDAFVSRVPTDSVDGYDLFILEAMQAHGVTQVVTDDGDFATIPGIRVFTANPTVIAAAKTQGRLVVR